LCGPCSWPSALTVGVVLVAGVGHDLIFGDRFKVDDGKVPIVLAFFGHQHLAGGKLMRAFVN
jgi:hypothetical protein